MVCLSVEAPGYMTQNVKQVTVHVRVKRVTIFLFLFLFLFHFFLIFLTASFFTNSVFLSFSSFIFALSSASLINCIDLGQVR